MARGPKSGSRRKWNFQGGGKAHALTLRALGYDCVDKDPRARTMSRDGVEIFVPIDPMLTPTAIQNIVQQSARSRDEYLLAWQAKKKQKLNCP
jgi:hypothetical protein